MENITGGLNEEDRSNIMDNYREYNEDMSTNSLSHPVADLSVE